MANGRKGRGRSLSIAKMNGVKTSDVIITEKCQVDALCQF